MAQTSLSRPRVTLVMVQSLDGRTTRGAEEGIYSWTSPEDSQLFFQLIASNHLIIMGRQTYEASRSKIQLRPDALRVVLTSEPAKYAGEVVPGQLEFSPESPAELLKRVAELGYTEALLVGGSQVTAAFLESGLVDELRLTIEPCLFGEGKPLTGMLSKVCQLQLKTVNQLNSQGTLHLEYLVSPRSLRTQ